MRFSSKTIPKNLDPSCKMDLDFSGLFWKGKSPSYAQINTILQFLKSKINLVIKQTVTHLNVSMQQNQHMKREKEKKIMNYMKNNNIYQDQAVSSVLNPRK